MDRNREAMECAEERYTLWAMNHLRHPGSMTAAFFLIESCIHNKEYERAEHYARHAMFMINDMTDNFIPSEERPRFLADASHYLARAIYWLTVNSVIPPVEKQKVGVEAIEYARQALKIHTQLYGIEHSQVACDMTILADALDYFNNVDDDEVLRLRKQAVSLLSRIEGSLSYNVATAESNLGRTYGGSIAKRALDANDWDRGTANLNLALLHCREAVRIYQAINLADKANDVLHNIAVAEDSIRKFGIAKAKAAVSSATVSKG